jgi:nucleoside 2-deoxyribosyltransferase
VSSIGTLRVYVAGASKEPERVRWAMDSLRSAGCKVTLDWLAVIEKAGSANEGLSDAQRARAAHDDLVGVQVADVLWVLAPENTSTGAWVELGYALALGTIVVVSGHARTRSIFAALAGHEFDSDDEALEHIVSASRPHRRAAAK